MNSDRNIRRIGFVLLAVIMIALLLAFGSNWLWPPAPVGAQ